MKIQPLAPLGSRQTTIASLVGGILVFLISLCGCETPILAHYPPTNPSDIIVTTDPYNGPHQQIKFLYGMFPGGASREQMAQYLQQEGSKVGADMVVESTLKTDMFGMSEATGLAIKLMR